MQSVPYRRKVGYSFFPELTLILRYIDQLENLLNLSPQAIFFVYLVSRFTHFVKEFDAIQFRGENMNFLPLFRIRFVFLFNSVHEL
jgi:hypothetical protein